MRRDSPLSIKVTQSARDQLDQMTLKFDRSQGYLIEKMIRRAYEDCEPQKKKVKKVKKLPDNFDEQFEELWISKGRRGTKSKARKALEKWAVDGTDISLRNFVGMLMVDIELKLKDDVIGFEAQHLSTYINGECWES